jgi:hypothetical protein
MIRYGLIRDNEIVKIRSLVTDDVVLVPKLMKHDYRIIEEQAIPVHDLITQLLTSSYEILSDKILKQWTVTEKSLAESRVAKKNAVDEEAISSIRQVFDASDQETKVANILAIKYQAVSAINSAKTNTDLRVIVPEYPVEESKLAPQT